LPPNQSSVWSDAEDFGNGFLVSEKLGGGGFTFLCVSPPASGKPVESWSIPPLAFDILDYAVYPPEDVIAVVEKKEKCAPDVLFSFGGLTTNQS
jgi:hypothetical protein